MGLQRRAEPRDIFARLAARRPVAVTALATSSRGAVRQARLDISYTHGLSFAGVDDPAILITG